MHYRALGRTGWKVSEISFGAWAIGGSWGQVSDEESMAALHKAIDCGVNFIDTADVYGGGRSERLIARLKKERKNEEFIVLALLLEPGDQALAATAAIDVRGIDKIHAAVDGLMQRRHRFFIRNLAPRPANRPGAKADF